jgi:uncharacterized membrane protein YeaQ/YmgE (transglycosylase-associated protein family)
MLALLGLQTLPTEMLYFLAFMAIAVTAIFGWTTDLVLKTLGFGPIGNSLLGVIGAVFGPRIWLVGVQHGSIYDADPSVLLTCMGAGGSILLIAAALLRRAVARI